MTTPAGPDRDQVRNIAQPPGGGPTVRRILLGAQLRRLREAKRISLEEAGKAIRGSHSKISRLENGKVGFKVRDIDDLLTLYGVADEQEREAVHALAVDANAHGWWHNYSDILPQWFEDYVGLEEAATQIRSYQVQFVPGLLQTGDYTRAVRQLGHPTASERDLDRWVALRLARQAVLTRPSPPSIWAVVDEAALRRPVGGPAVMRAQLRHLLEVAQRPSVTIQIVPFHAGGHAAAGGPFSILRFADYDLPDVVYLEQLTSALYMDKPDVVDTYLMVMERLCIVAVTPAQSIKMLRDLIKATGQDN